MKCIICQQVLPDDSGSCPKCGMSPVPELFLNPEQYRQWKEQIFFPAREAYARQQKQIIAEQILELRRSTSLFAAAGIDFYAWLDNGSVKLEGFFNSNIGKAKKWEHIKAIAAGTGHLAALSQDGRVLTAGKNTMGQCDAGNWKGVAKIAASGDTTAAVTEDGVLLACGADAERLRELSTRLEQDVFIREIALTQTQIFLLASYRKKEGMLAVCEYHRDVFQEGHAWSAEMPEEVSITAGDAGCFLLRNHTAEAVNSGADSAEMAEAVNRAGAGKIDGITAGREMLFAFAKTGEVSGAAYRKGTAPFSFRIPFPDSETILLNLLELDDMHLLAAVLSGGERQLLVLDISDKTVPGITRIGVS